MTKAHKAALLRLQSKYGITTRISKDDLESLITDLLHLALEKLGDEEDGDSGWQLLHESALNTFDYECSDNGGNDDYYDQVITKYQTTINQKENN